MLMKDHRLRRLHATDSCEERLKGCRFKSLTKFFAEQEGYSQTARRWYPLTPAA
jgi:hypothetical protein